MKITCDLCGSRFDPHRSPTDVVGDKWICCGDRYTPEELAEELEVDVAEVCKSLGIKESK